jgi:hypothetical protein
MTFKIPVTMPSQKKILKSGKCKIIQISTPKHTPFDGQKIDQKTKLGFGFCLFIDLFGLWL